MFLFPPIVLITKMDRTQEVLLCERELMESNIHKPLPVFLNLFFDEVCVKKYSTIFKTLNCCPV